MEYKFGMEDDINKLADSFKGRGGTNQQYDRIISDLRFIRDRYGIRPAMHRLGKSDDIDLDGHRMTFREAVVAVRIFKEELIKYPPSLIRRAGITRLRILENLIDTSDKNEPDIILGQASEPGEIYIATLDDVGEYRDTIHHELSHRLDYQRNNLNGRVPFFGWLIDEFRDSALDDEWVNMNKSNGIKYAGKEWINLRGSRPVGFARRYGTYSPKEDRATIAGQLMANTRNFRALCRRDHLLNLKTTALMALYEADSRGLMNRRYFQDLESGMVNEGYWLR